VPDSGMRIIFVDRMARLEPFEVPTPAAGELLVRARCSLVSIGTESTALTSRWDHAGFRANPGYALAGDVAAVGSGVEGFRQADRVITLRGHASHAITTTNPWETLKIPDGVSYDDATVSVLASVALHGLRRARIQLGESVAVIGMGIVGLLTLRFARMQGARPLVGIDISPQRLALGAEFGADHVIDARDGSAVDRVRALTGGAGADCVFEAAGSPRTLPEAMAMCVTGGRVVAVGVVAGTIALNLCDDFILRELTLVSAQQPINPVIETPYWRFTQQANRAMILKWIACGDLAVGRLVSHRIPWRDAPAFYDRLAQAKDADYEQGTSRNRELLGVLIDWTC